MNPVEAVFTDNLAMWNLVVGFFLPPLLAVIQQPGFSKPVKAMLTFVVCLLMSIVTLALDDTVGLNFQSWVTSSLMILVTTIATYQSLWKPTGIAPAIEAATSRAVR
jgi:uncharacterized membrane protein YqaE (UPF0057 family)